MCPVISPDFVTLDSLNLKYSLVFCILTKGNHLVYHLDAVWCVKVGCVSGLGLGKMWSMCICDIYFGEPMGMGDQGREGGGGWA